MYLSNGRSPLTLNARITPANFNSADSSAPENASCAASYSFRAFANCSNAVSKSFSRRSLSFLEAGNRLGQRSRRGWMVCVLRFSCRHYGLEFVTESMSHRSTIPILTGPIIADAFTRAGGCGLKS
jgi:hypothetical protein